MSEGRAWWALEAARPMRVRFSINSSLERWWVASPTTTTADALPLAAAAMHCDVCGNPRVVLKPQGLQSTRPASAQAAASSCDPAVKPLRSLTQNPELH